MEIKKADFGVYLGVKDMEHFVLDEGGEDMSYLREVVLPLAKAMKPECVQCRVVTIVYYLDDKDREDAMDFEEEFSDGDELIEFLEKITYTEKFLDINTTAGLYKYVNEKFAEMAKPPERQAWE